MGAFVSWWLAVELLGLAALPVTGWVMRWLPGRGYAFCKVVGLLLVSYIVWFGAMTGMLSNDPGGITFAVLLVAALSAWASIGSAAQPLAARVKQYWQDNKVEILAVEALFLLAFAGWTLVRAYAPDKILPAGGEKYMEIAFLNGVLNSAHFPPIDPWLAGFGISYYYFGYVMMGIMTRLTGVAPTVGFDLYDALLFALTAVSAFGVVSAMVAASAKSSAGKKVAALSGLLGALFVGMLGNLQGLVEGLYSSKALPQAFWKWLDIPDLAGSAQNGGFYPGDSWWWWRASRVLHDMDLFGKPVPYQPIDEFPFFSFLLGDNHPHKLALPFVLLCIALALNLLLKITSGSRSAAPMPRSIAAAPGWAWQNREELAFWAFYALALGSLGFLNTWDMPIYLLVIMLAYIAGRYVTGERLQLPLFLRVFGVGAVLGFGAVSCYILFYLGFSSQAGGILPYVFAPTRLVQYLVMFGPFIFILAVYLALAAARSASAKGAGFPWQDTLRVWLWIVGLVYGLYLAALSAGILLLSFSGGSANPLLQAWFSGLGPGEIFIKTLQNRLANPWMFLLLSLLLALAVTAFLRIRSGWGALQAGVDLPVPGLSPAALFGLVLAFTGIGLTLSVEFFYLRDLFGMRMNTIFKFYFQGWVLMACASAYAVWWVARSATKILRGVFLTAAAGLIAAGLVYPVMAVRSRAESFHGYPVLDAAASFAGVYPGHWAAQPADWKAIQWLNEHVRPAAGEMPIILEAPGGGYQNYDRVSAFTGLPTLLGWTNHEGQWRGSSDEINRRMPDIQAIYTTPSTDQALDLLHKWNVRYLVLGDAERQFITETCSKPEMACNPTRGLAKFDHFLTPVYSEAGITIYAVP